MSKVLVVDDVKDNVKLLAYDLEDEGYEVITAYNGAQALERVKKDAPDIILLDILMPDINGLEVCRMIKKSPATCHVPIIMISSKESEDSVIEGLDAGALDYITKPYSFPVVSARVRSAIRIKKYQDMIFEMNESLDKARKIAETSASIKNEFMAKMSHEIKTPINGIVGTVSLLKNTTLDSDQTEYVDIIDKSSDNLLVMIDDVLNLTKINSGNIEINESEFNLHDAIEDVVALLSEKAYDKNIDFHFKLQLNLPGQVFGDEIKIKQVLMNLLSNAIKFTDCGYVSVEVSLSKPVKLGLAVIELKVRDTGIGIAKESQGNIFTPYFQADESISKRFGGTGLGLSIIKQLIKVMGGDISFTSDIGEGTEFVINLPVDVRTDVDYENIIPFSLSSKKILIIDACKHSQSILKYYLEGFHAKVVVCEGVSEAEKQIKISHIDDSMFDFIFISDDCSVDELKKFPKTIKQIAPEPCPHVILMCRGYKHAHNNKLNLKSYEYFLAKPLFLSRIKKTFEECFHKVELTLDSGQRAAGNKKILIAEDNKANQFVIRKMLESNGYNVDVVGDGKSAVAAYMSGQYDMILMDCHMPIMDGISASKEIRTLEESNKHTPIIAMTASILMHDKESYIDMGVDDFIEKPLKIEDLTSIVKKWYNYLKLTQ